MTNINFGQAHNGLSCNCGKHYGVGEWDAGRRAAAYARMRDRLPAHFTSQQQNYLEDWEKIHGKVTYELIPTEIKVTKENHLEGSKYPVGSKRIIQFEQITSYNQLPAALIITTSPKSWYDHN